MQQGARLEERERELYFPAGDDYNWLCEQLNLAPQSDRGGKETDSVPSVHNANTSRGVAISDLTRLNSKKIPLKNLLIAWTGYLSEVPVEDRESDAVYCCLPWP